MAAQAAVIPSGRNLAIVVALVALNLFQFLVLPLVLLPLSPWWGLALVPVVLSTTPLWSTIHEAIHGMLFADRARNERAGRLLGVLFGCPFQLLRLGHLQHHRFNRTQINRMEVIEEAPPVSLLDRASYYFRLLAGLYLAELAASPLAMLPDLFYRPLVVIAFGDETPDGKSMWAAAKRQLLDEPARTRMRVEGAVITLLFALSLYLYGAMWWLLVLALLGRGFLISFFDNAYHYANPLDEILAGYNLRLPSWAQAWFLNFNLHRSHHHRPSIPWTGLPAVQEELDQPCEDGFVPAAIRQLRGPLPVTGFPAPEEAGAGRNSRAGSAATA